jgi:hypothetical protein
MEKKKKYRDIHNETRVGKFLRSIKKSGMVGKAIDAAGSLASGDVLGALKDLLVTDNSISAEDKAFALEQLRLDIERERGVTERWKADLKYGTILTKNIRPVILIALTATFIVGFFMKEYKMDVVADMLTITLTAYFSVRTIDKVIGKRD